MPHFTQTMTDIIWSEKLKKMTCE